MLVRLKRFDEAIRSFDVCLAQGTPSASLYEARGLALAHAAPTSVRSRITPWRWRGAGATASLYSHRGWAYLFSGAPGPAARDFDEALRLDPSDGRALSGRALANVQQHKVREAVADARASAQTPGQRPPAALQRRPGLLPGRGLSSSPNPPGPRATGRPPAATAPRPWP